MDTSQTEQDSTSESKTVSEMQGEIQALKEELSSLKRWMFPEISRNAKDGIELRSRRVYPNLVEVLKGGAFTEAYSMLVEELERAMFNTQPDQSEARERLYQQAQGLQSVLTRLTFMTRTVQNAKPES